jgi:hypothetical protein
MTGTVPLPILLFRFVLFALCVSATIAQTDTGAISGVVTDASGATVPGAVIIITQQETNVPVSLTTNETGFYSEPALQAGTYQIEVSTEGS